MRQSFDDFVASFHVNKVVENSSVARHIYNNIIWNDSVRIKMVELSESGLPALAACVKEIEKYCTSLPSCDLDLCNDTVKQTIGRMVSSSMAPFGYTPKHKRPLSRKLNLIYFVTTKSYVYTGNETQRVVKSIVDC
ncbi:hypothetical protein R9X47_28725 [Wukongibacter baidiensis]|uniref:hypothetical protein n=1 Tax=Wukongibacter baidiensis TaxID=1723361 RepID=UPI003D7FF13F